MISRLEIMALIVCAVVATGLSYLVERFAEQNRVFELYVTKIVAVSLCFVPLIAIRELPLYIVFLMGINPERFFTSLGPEVFVAVVSIVQLGLTVFFVLFLCYLVDCYSCEKEEVKE